MAIYSEVSISGYNSSPPPDDGTQVSTNEITWSGIKTKLADPLQTALVATQTAITTMANQVGLVLLTSGTVTSAVTKDIVLTNYTAYRALKFVLMAWKPATDDVGLRMRTSTNGGSDYDAGGSDYTWAMTVQGSFDADDSGGDGSDSVIRLTNGVGNSTGEQVNLEINLFNQTAAEYVTVAWHGNFFYNDTNLGTVNGAGARLAQTDVDAVRFLFSSGNIASGKYAVYGYQ